MSTEPTFDTLRDLFESTYPDSEIYETVDGLFDRLANPDVYPDDTAISGLLAFGDLRKLEGFYASRIVVSGMVVLVCALLLDRAAEKLSMVDKLRTDGNFKSAAKGYVIGLTQRLVPHVIERAEKRFGKPSFIDNEKIMEYVARVTLTINEANMKQFANIIPPLNNDRLNG